MATGTDALTRTVVDPAVALRASSPLEGASVPGDFGVNSVNGVRSGGRVHLIETDSGLRARLARLVLSHHYHAEIFSNVEEFIAYAPEDGIIFANETALPGRMSSIIDRIAGAGVDLPLVAYGAQPSIDDVVSAMRAGVVDFLPLDLFEANLVKVLDRASVVAERGRKRRARVGEARKRLQGLSNREHQVLGLLVDGCSNKEIARRLDISPRTVEIHRMKMMAKMNARSSSDAVRLWCAAATDF